MSDSDPIKLFTYVANQLNEREIAYIHMIEPRATSAGGTDTIVQNMPSTSKIFKSSFNGSFISAGGYTPETAKETVDSGIAEAIAFGRFFISNPDLPDRIKAGIKLNPYDRATFYGGTAKGYTDYPFMNSQ
jgi:N-ethylmaleimide reductase